MKKVREIAIKKYLNGESPKEIYRSPSKGKTWFFKWLKRYKLDGARLGSRTFQKTPS